MKSFKLARSIGGALVLSALFVTAVFAQQMGQLPAGMLPDAAGQLIRGPQITPSPLDQARLDRLQETPFQRAMREFQPASAIEKLYRQRLGMVLENIPPQQPGTKPDPAIIALNEGKRSAISQFGYDVFAGVNYPLENVSGSIPDSYTLGVGDELVIYLKGAEDRSFITAIDREGRFIIPRIEPIMAAGLSLGEFKTLIKAAVEEVLLGVEVSVSMGSLRNITAYVFGEVRNPGAFLMTSYSTPLEALAAAAGISKTGTLRGIKVIFGDDCSVAGNCHTLDLYELMTTGKGADIRLKDGVRIVVPKLGKTVAVAGDVVVPGIYEMPYGKSEVSANELIAYAGGTIRPRGFDVDHYRIGDDGADQLDAFESLNNTVEAFDILDVKPKTLATAGQVSLTGEVAYDGTRPLNTNKTLAALVSSRDDLGEDPYLPFAVLETTDKQSKARIYEGVNLEHTLAGVSDYALQDRDRLYVLNADDIAFLSEPALRDTLISGVNRTVCTALDHLADYTKLVDNQRFTAVNRSVFVTSAIRGANYSGNSEAQILQSESASLEVQNNKQMAQGNLSPEQIALQEKAREQATADFCSPLFERNPKLLPYVLENAVSLLGAVRRPGVYPVSADSSMASVIGVGGGFASNADMSQVELMTFGSSADEGAASTTYYNTANMSLEAVAVPVRSSIRVPNVVSEEEPGSVLLTGEFNRPGLYTIRKGETLSQLIQRAGGLSRFAYPYGAVMTRRAVAEQQREGFARASREINNALASAAIKADLSGDALSAVSALANDLATVDALGRMVVEADPADLLSKGELDTILEAGDRIHMPKRPSYVLVAGDVLNPGALRFEPGRNVEDYLAQAGGMTMVADDDRVFVVYPNGVAQPVSLSAWSSNTDPLPPGTTIVVPKDMDPFTLLEISREISQVLSSLAVSIASLSVIAGN